MPQILPAKRKARWQTRSHVSLSYLREPSEQNAVVLDMKKPTFIEVAAPIDEFV
ncbi:MAG: hypothetical protein LUC43_01340 [Burkholderiales bacterium]|nr:hypothetical protein [Burkholderiales bacterium]